MIAGQTLLAGGTDQSVLIRFLDADDGTELTTLTFESAGLQLRYRRPGATVQTITPATLAAADTAHTDGGFIHLHAGVYRVDLPDAAAASGVTSVLVSAAVTGGVAVPAIVPVVPSNTHVGLLTGADLLAVNAAEVDGETPEGSDDIAAAVIAESTTGASAGTLGGVVNAVLVNTDRVDGLIEDSTGDRFTAKALEEGPTGGGDSAATIATAVWGSDTRTLTAGTNIALAKGTGVTGFNDLDAAGVRTAVGMSSANLDTQLSGINSAVGGLNDLDAADVRGAVGLASANLDTQLGAIQSTADDVETDTQDIQGRLPASLNNGAMVSDIQRINDVEIVGDGDGTPFNVAGA